MLFHKQKHKENVFLLCGVNAIDFDVPLTTKTSGKELICHHELLMTSIWFLIKHELDDEDDEFTLENRTRETEKLCNALLVCL